MLYKKFDGNKLLLITTRQQIFIVYAKRFIKKVVSNKLYVIRSKDLLALTSIGALKRRPNNLLATSLLICN